MRKQTFVLLWLLVFTGCVFLDPPTKTVIDPETGKEKQVLTGEKAPAEELGFLLAGLGIPLLTMAGAGLKMAAKARRLQRATVHATEVAIANGSLASAKDDKELREALRNAQTMVQDAELIAGYFQGKEFKKTKAKVRALLPGSDSKKA